MKLDDLLGLLSDDIAKSTIDPNSPGEMVRASLAGQMPDARRRLPMSLAGAPVTPVTREALPPVTPAAPPMTAPMRAGAAPAPVPNQPSWGEDFMAGAAGEDLLSGIIGGLWNASSAPEKRAREAQEKAQRQNLTVRALKARNPNMADDEALFVATSGDQDLLRKYLAPQEAAKPEYREVGGRLVQIGPDGVKEVYAPPSTLDRKALTEGAGAGKMWNDPNDPTKGVRDIPGAEKPVKPPSAIQTEASKANMAYNSLVPAIDQYVETVRKYGAEGMSGPAKDLMGQQLRDIQLQLKELYNLGVLNGPDLALMEQMLFDPRIGFNPLDWSNAYNAVGRTEQSAEQLKTILKRIRDTKVQEAGQDGGAPMPTAPQPSQNAAPVKITSDDHWAQLPPGTKYIDPDGNERVKQ